MYLWEHKKDISSRKKKEHSWALLRKKQRFHINTKKEIFYNKNIQSLQLSPQGNGRVPIEGNFQEATGEQGAR